VQQNKRALATAVGAIFAGPVSMATAQVTGANVGNVEEILVYGTQGARDSVTASRLDLSLLETPATIDVIDGDAIRARVDLSVLEAATRSAGFTNASNPGNGNSSISARGFSGQGAVTKLYDGTNYYNAADTVTFPFDTWGVERIEVLKGPSSVLYGEGGIGGAINVIPRKPEQDRSGDVRVMLGENDTAFIGVDFTTGLSEAVALRLDYSNSQSDNWVEPNGDSEAELFSVALQWNAADDLVLSARLDNGDQKPMRYFGVPNVNDDFFDDFVGLNLNVSDAELRYEDDSLRVEADWQATDTVSLEAEIYQLSADRFWKNTEAYFYDDGAQLVERWDPLVLGHDMEQTGMRTNLTFAPSRGGLLGTIGFEANDVSFERPTNFGNAGNPDGITFDEFDVVDPYAFVPGVLADIATAPIVLDNTSDVSEWAVFGEAQFQLGERVALVAALRRDDYDTSIWRSGGRAGIEQQADATTGRLGVVFDLAEETALYAQYGTGATHPSAGVVTSSPANSGAEMIESEQIELGIKHQVEGTGFQWNLALFDIVKNNVIYPNLSTPDPSDAVTVPEQSSQGFEVGFTFTASSAFQVYGNAASYDTEDDTDARPAFYIPEQTYNLGMAWAIGDAFRVVADARYVGDRFGAITMPSYTVVDASARWDSNDRLGFTVKADNIFDELYATSNYYDETWLIGRPRMLSLVMDVRF
jgi:iron complex outermembrane receptor protein